MPHYTQAIPYATPCRAGWGASKAANLFTSPPPQRLLVSPQLDQIGSAALDVGENVTLLNPDLLKEGIVTLLLPQLAKDVERT